MYGNYPTLRHISFFSSLKAKLRVAYANHEYHWVKGILALQCGSPELQVVLRLLVCQSPLIGPVLQWC